MALAGPAMTITAIAMAEVDIIIITRLVLRIAAERAILRTVLALPILI
jgi:hypothetical protein